MSKLLTEKRDLRLGKMRKEEFFEDFLSSMKSGYLLFQLGERPPMLGCVSEKNYYWAFFLNKDTLIVVGVNDMLLALPFTYHGDEINRVLENMGEEERKKVLNWLETHDFSSHKFKTVSEKRKEQYIEKVKDYLHGMMIYLPEEV